MKKYTIPENFHISHILPKFYRNKNSVCFDFQFCSNCKYNIGVHNQDVNKLAGVSFGLIHNTTTLWGRLFKSNANSFRIGWNCELQNGKIQLFAYYYNNGVRTIKYLCDVEVNKQYTASLHFDRTTNEIIVDISAFAFSKIGRYDFNFSRCPRFGFWLFFFFGGRLASPHKMSCYINQY